MTNKQRLATVRRARRHLHAATGYDPQGGHYKAVDAALDALEAEFKITAPKWAGIGAVTKGGASLLDMSLTHATSGIALFPAVDLAWGSGVPMYAPESVTVDTKDTSANPGEALYLRGASGMRYWFAHLDRDHRLGTKFAKGAFLANTAYQLNKKAHGHVGVNAEVFLGRGKQFKYGRTGNGPDYTLGAPTIRRQLEALEL